MFDSLFPSFPSLFGEEQISGKVAVTEKTTERGEINDGGMRSYAFSGMQGWRLTMEDAHMACSSIPIYKKNKSLSKGHAIFGVFDGHGGALTSEFAADNFMGLFSKSSKLRQYSNLSTKDQSDVTGVQMIRSALKETFANLDLEIRLKQRVRNDKILAETKAAKSADDHVKTRPRVERSGSTCVVVMITPSHIICANAGDSRAIIQRNGKVLPLSFDHKPNNIPELQRINHAGGFVKSGRVDGDLAVSRGLGDYAYKKKHKMSVDKQKVIPEPEFVVYPRNVDLDEFVVLACDGVWDVATNEQCAEFVQNMMNYGETDIGVICEYAIDICLKKNSRDNMTLGVIALDAAKFETRLTLGNATRQAKEVAESATRVAAEVGNTIATTIIGTASQQQQAVAVK
jgi:serine/threonine protein phosphatase PrpC